MADATRQGSGVPGCEVLKFGGSTLGDPARLRAALDVIATARLRRSIAVVVSALGDTTDLLIASSEAAARGDATVSRTLVDGLVEQAARVFETAIGASAEQSEALRTLAGGSLAPLRKLLAGLVDVGDCSPALRDQVLGFGELTSASLVALALRMRGIDALAVDARTWLVTDDRHGEADVIWPATAERVARFSPGWCGAGVVSVHTGFLGATDKGRPTTLGRNGSDYTAALLARAVHASEVSIWTDVSGVMTADPGIVHEAYPVPRLSYREALELAGLGLRMFHPRTMVPLLSAGIPMRIRNSARPDDPGTVVDAAGSPDEQRPTCVASLEDMALVSIEGSHGTADARIAVRGLAALGQAGIAVPFSAYAHHGNGLAFVVRQKDAGRAVTLVETELSRELGRGDLSVARVASPVSVVTLVGEAMGRTANVAGRFFGAIGAVGVNVAAASQGATSRAISCVVDAADTAVAVRAVHAAFNLAREQVNVLLLGKGTVGGHLLEQLGAEREQLRDVHDLDVRLFGVVDRTASISSNDGLDPRDALVRLRHSGDPPDVIALLDRLRRLPVPVLVDCTAADGMERVYEEAFARGIHVVTANKKPFALPTPAREKLFAAARRAHRGLRYETTVGASLPVIETVKNLFRTGDRVRLIEASLSGTLGFLANMASGGERLSVSVRAAHARGYTEPHPRDDLSGLDAARKALILARELGVELELEDVEVEAFVPAKLMDADDREAFFAGLELHDATFEAKIAGLREEGCVLRYLARIVPPALGERVAVRVAPVAVAADHPAARLRGTEALVAFHTERYDEYPLVVQGAGAGGAVTAAGVLADVLALSQTLRGR
jgi:aspartokinase/homoserine dehydrogenase 1